MNCSTPGLPVHHQLLEFTQTHVHWVGDAIQPSHPLLSPSPPAFNLSQCQGIFQWLSSSHQVVKRLEFQLQHFYAIHNKKLRVLGFLRVFFLRKISHRVGLSGGAMERIHLQCRRQQIWSPDREGPWGKKWHLTPVLLPGKLHGQRNLAVYSPWGHRELDTTYQLSACTCVHAQTHTHTHTHAHTSCSVTVKVCPRHRPSFSSALSPSATWPGCSLDWAG